MICFKCDEKFQNCSQLITHLKYFHNLNQHSEYECAENNCYQKFQNLHSFRRHIKNQHIHDHLVEPSTSKTSNIGIDLCKSNSFNLSFAENEDDMQNFPISINSPKGDENYDPFSKLSFLIKNLQESSVKFTLEMHQKSNFSRKDVLFIQETVEKSIVQPIIETFRYVNECVSKKSLSNLDVENTLKNISELFVLCSTEHRLTTWLKKNDLIEDPKDFVMNDEIAEVSHMGNIRLEAKLSKGVVLPLNFYFRKIFEKGDNLKVCLENANSVCDQYKSTFVHGDLWKRKSKDFDGKPVIPFFLYFDDLEINDALGSHSDSVGAFYYIFPGLGSSKLDNIFLGGFIKTSDLKKFGNSVATCKLIDEINNLYSQGIEVLTGEKKINVKFLLGLVIGDNLGLNGLLDFTKSFNANYFCRFCKCSKSESYTEFIEDSSKLRTIDNYLEDVTIDNSSLTGINSDSIFNTVEKFHITENYSLDFMHLFPEGILHYDLGNILEYFIKKQKLFTLDDLNRRKRNFSYGEIEIGNICNDIKINHLNKHHFKMSSREMMTFANFLPLMIGDLIPEGDEVWKYLCNLLTIMDLLLSKHFDSAKLNYIKLLVCEQNKNYYKLFNENLKPKHHLLIHFVRIIEMAGPPKESWCYRCEAKHKEFKMYCRIMTSRKHICLSLVKKYQLKFASYLLSDEKFLLNFNSKHLVCHNFDSIPKNLLSMHISYYSQVTFKGTLYKENFILTRFLNEELCAYKIKSLAICNSELKVVCSKLNLLLLSEHYHAYIINDLISSNVTEFISIEEFSGPPINSIRIANGLNLLRLKEYF